MMKGYGKKMTGMKVEFNEELHQYKVDGKPVPSVTEIIGLLTKDKYSINASVLARAAHRGTVVHELCELYDYDALPEEIDEEVYPFLLAYQKFVKDYAPEWVAVEKILATNYCAGTADRIGYVDGHLVVVDLKTTASMDRLSKICLACQLYAYAVMFEQEVDINRCFGVQLKKDGSYAILPYSDICDKYEINPPEILRNLFNITMLIRGEKWPNL